MQLFGREGFSFANDGYTVLTIKIGALDRTIVSSRNAHVGPVNMSGLNIDHDSVRNPASGHNHPSVGAVGVSRMNPAAAGFQEKQAPCCRGRRCAVWFG